MAVRNDLLPVALRNQAKLEAGEACDSLNYNLRLACEVFRS